MDTTIYDGLVASLVAAAITATATVVAAFIVARADKRSTEIWSWVLGYICTQLCRCISHGSANHPGQTEGLN
ncbi:hypothetical protein F4821DRAFT_239724 [Hypoxylon rubiginosum]|uniref:Uncharacterized protein n=1 Tax=Hypoxylon rubiginosum TaxID=110542 RepID=A0ACC0CZU8_9PEZI|nr:hypothetical protein F4821DRAFT_239724 [Hypoxylon rubiginosum]